MKNILDKLNVNNLNSVIYLSLKILKILYILIIFLALYLFVLVSKEFKIFKIFLIIIKLSSPLFIGIIIAYLLNPIVKLFEKKINRKITVTIIYLIILVLFVLFCLYIYPKFQNEFIDLGKNIPSVIDETNVILNNIIHKISLNFNKEYTINVKEMMEQYLNNFNMKNINIIICTIKNAFSIIGIILLSLIISFYLLLDFDKITNFIINVLENSENNKIIKLLKEMDEKVFSFVKGTLLIAFIVFIISSIGFIVSGLNAPMFFGFYNALTNIIPYIGPYIGGIPIVVVAFTSSKKVGIVTLIVVIIIQIIESYALQPIIMSKSMKIHPVTILIGLLLFGYFFGIIGMVIAMPVISIIKTIIIFLIKENDNK